MFMYRIVCEEYSGTFILTLTKVAGAEYGLCFGELLSSLGIDLITVKEVDGTSPVYKEKREC